jgi:hypothetical protein
MQIHRIRRKRRMFKVVYYPDALIDRTRSTAIPAIVEKCLSSTRAGTKAKAVEALLLYVELDTPEPVLVQPLDEIF